MTSQNSKINLSYAALGRFGTLYVWAADRLLRTLKAWIQIKEVIDTVGGLQIRCLTGADIDPSTPAGNLIFGLMVIMAENEGLLKAERQRAQFVQSVNAGDPPRIRGFGFNVDGSLNEREAAAVREMYQRFNSGQTLVAIMNWMNSLDLTNTKGNKWTRVSVRGLLMNPRNYGVRAIQTNKNVHEWQIVNEECTWPGIVDKQTFEIARIRLDEQAARHPRDSAAKWLGPSLYECDCGGIIGTHYQSGGKTQCHVA